jgi:hypothetical protein
MTNVDAPRPVRIATALTWAMLSAGVLLLLAGIVELHWWGSSAPTRLNAIFAAIEQQEGPARPGLLRGYNGAVELVISGVACLVYAGLAPLLARGRRWARTVALIAGAVLVLGAMLGVGADLDGPPTSLHDYVAALPKAGFGQWVPQIEPLRYPAWYSWLEDIAQGLYLVLTVACLAAIGSAVVTAGDYFTTRKADEAGPDEWAAAISRIHRETVDAQRPEPTQP